MLLSMIPLAVCMPFSWMCTCMLLSYASHDAVLFVLQAETSPEQGLSVPSTSR